MNFENKTILITGASTGIGKEIAKVLAPFNCRLVLIARRKNLLDELKDDLQKGSKAVIHNIQCDVGNKNEVVAAFTETINNFGSIDIAILNAGYGERITVQNFNSRVAEKIFGANTFGIIYWVEQLLPDFIQKKRGMIVGVSSLADNRGYSGSGFYCASKAAASIYLEGLRIELMNYNVKVITVKPGFVKSPMTDKNEFRMPFLMETNKAAQIIVDGIKKEKRIIRFPLPTVIGSKLISYMPSWLYEILSYRQFHREI